jgi:carbamate kinase
VKTHLWGLESVRLGHRGAGMNSVVALGGNAELQRGDKPDAGVQVVHMRTAGQALAPLVSEHEVLICRVNGPQVGMLASERGSGRTLTRSSPLDDLVTQTAVDATDSAFGSPTKFVEPGHPKEQVVKMAGRAGGSVAVDGDYSHRVVASPEPLRIIERSSVAGRLDSAMVICPGRGGTAVTESSDHRLARVETAVDKYYVAAVPAITAGGDPLIVRTDVPAVMTSFRIADRRPRRAGRNRRYHRIANHTTRHATASRDRQANQPRTRS